MAVRLPDLRMSSEAMRSLVLEHLSRNIDGPHQFNDLYSSIANLAVEHGFHDAPKSDPIGARYGGSAPDSYYLSQLDCTRAGEVIWDLIIEGVLRPGTTTGDPALPFFHLTEYGREHLKEEHPRPHDPDGYLKRLMASVPDLDETVLTYLTESLKTFRIGCLLSSTTTLGCASEKALLLLFEAYAMALSGEKQERFRKDIDGKPMKRKFDEFHKRLDSHLVSHLPGDIKEHLDIALIAISALLREMRNDAGHPTGKAVAREQAYANLAVFPTYLKKVYELIHWLQANKL